MQREIGMNCENMNKNTVILLSKAKLLLYLLDNFKFYISQFLKAFKFLSVSILLHNLVKSFLTSIKFTLGSLSRKIKNPCLVINKKFFNKGDTLMYQNRISLLLILAFSLSILISCGGDTGTNIKSGKVHTGYYD